MRDLDQLQLFPNDRWQFGEILRVSLRQQERLDPTPVRRKRLLTQAADRQDLAPQRHLARHRDILADLASSQRRDQGRRHGDASRGSILGDRTRRDVDMNIVLVKEPGLDLECRCPRPRIGHRRPCRLLHHVTKLTGKDQISLAFHDRNFNGEQVAANAGDGGARRHTNLVLLLGKPEVVTRYAEIVVDISSIDLHPLRWIGLGKFPRNLTAECSDLPLEVSDA